ncbi:MAG: hypothetical protein NAG76_22260 [Candidatus Pristimantibacillus lignocellulolyticus]|uniref:Uncharacterized protein n=1 Tax=Candidatus Pristimantibacillus lignocellulolyticus TaxID=2994561 RepID=A0A9J6ZEC0_9BACL|nr:MAG: hypothetical protein NAG76_22260 [Candidatus Pristimantibacillus lignocellulolyticus]
MGRPLRVTKTLRKVYESIKDNPGIKSKEVVKKSEIHPTSVFNMLLWLQQINLIHRVFDTDRQYQCYVTNVDIEEVFKQQEELYKEFVAQRDANAVVEMENEEDKLLDSLHTFSFTQAHLKIIKENKGMRRTPLAKKLGISKLELTVGLDKLKRKSINS